MRVPIDPHQPSWDHTFEIGYWKFHRQSKAIRREWSRRRMAAVRAAHRQKMDQLHARQADVQAQNQRPRPGPATHQQASTDRRTAQSRPRRKRVNLLGALEDCSYTAELFVILAPVLVFIACVIGVVVLYFT